MDKEILELTIHGCRHKIEMLGLKIADLCKSGSRGKVIEKYKDMGHWMERYENLVEQIKEMERRP
jgi:hypothetical protein